MLYRGRDRARLARSKDLAREAGVPLIAVNDVHYHHPDRRPLADVVTCIREKLVIDRAGRSLAANAERFLKPREEMARLFRDAPEAIEETLHSERATHLLARRTALRISRRDHRRLSGRASGADASRLRRRGQALSARPARKSARRNRARAGADRAAAIRALLPHRLRHRPLRPHRRKSSARAAARRPIPRSASASASPRSIPTAPICCSSASSRRSGASRPTSTSISSTSGARR